MFFCRRTVVFIACAVIQAGIPCAEAADWVDFYPLNGEFSLGVDGRWRENDSGQSTWQMEYEEKLNVRFGGHILDQRFFTFSGNLAPTFSQQKSDYTSGVSKSDTQFLNYGARFSLLHGVAVSPVSLNASFNATNGETEDNLGNRRESTLENRLAGLQIKFRPFRSSIVYRERSLEESFVSAFGQLPQERNEFQRTLSYTGRSRGMELFLEGTEFDDRTIQDQDYESSTARLNNNFNWGKGSRFNSRLKYVDRKGYSAEESATANESLHLQHTRNLFTSYDYGYRHSQRLTESESHFGQFELHHKLYSNLDTSLKVSGENTTSSEQFNEQTREASLDFSYNKKLRSNMRLSANLGGGYRTTERTGGVIDRAETAIVPATGVVILSERYIIWSSIVVAAPGCNPCLDGSDYLVEDAGGNFTQLQIPLGSRIAIDDTITVDYIFQPPTVEFYGIPYRVGLKLEYGPITIYHRSSGEQQTYVSGPDPTAVGDRRTDVTGLEWKLSRGRTQASAGIERIYITNYSQTSTEYLLSQKLTYGISPNALLIANLRESFFRNSKSADTYTGEMTINWKPAPRLTVKPRLSAFRRQVDSEDTNTILKAGVDVGWYWRRLELDFNYVHTEQQTNDRKDIEDRVVATIKRKF
jgi:hypothetical protein